MTNVAYFGVQHPTMHNFYIRFVPIWSVVQYLHIIKNCSRISNKPFTYY